VSLAERTDGPQNKEFPKEKIQIIHGETGVDGLSIGFKHSVETRRSIGPEAGLYSSIESYVSPISHYTDATKHYEQEELRAV
jgi:hypothetical protein